LNEGFYFASRRRTLPARSLIINAIRNFFLENGFLEVETPHRIPVPIPESHIDVMLSGNWVLHPSPEICMKRMLAAGFDRIFQICRCWRAGERGTLHLPEFTMLEWYRAYADYSELMNDCETLVRSATESVGPPGMIRRKDRIIDLSEPWEKLTVEDAFLRYAAMPVKEALARDMFDEIMVRDIEPMLGQTKPTFLVDYPAERGSLARLKPGQNDVAERFELYIAGIELANAFSELVDQEEQRSRFERERDFRRLSGKPDFPLPEIFLDQLPSMPPSAGIAMGVDRLIMLCMEAVEIDEVVAFTPEEL
jgi:elongation factor P--(R)-beta-lysine ligase